MIKFADTRNRGRVCLFSQNKENRLSFEDFYVIVAPC